MCVCMIHSSPFLSRQDIHMFTYRAAGSAVGSISSFGEKYRGVGMPITILIITLIIVIITIVIVTIVMIIITIIVTVIITIITLIVTISFFPLFTHWLLSGGLPSIHQRVGPGELWFVLKWDAHKSTRSSSSFLRHLAKKMPYTSIPSIFGRSYLSFTLCLFNVAMENHHFL